MPDQYAVIGNPVAHSKSPLIHARFAQQTSQDIAYGRVLAPLDGFEAAVEAFQSAGGKGLNVTLPFKLHAFDLATRRNQCALDAQAVNVLKFEADSVSGYNTDGLGLVRDIEQNLGIELKRKRILVMGAGGAAQGALGPLLGVAPSALVLANRTPAKARQLVERFTAQKKASGGDLRATSYGELSGAFDVVINATSASLQGTVPELPAGMFAPGALAYDMMYGKDPTPFLKLACREGAAVLADGLGMLVEQAAESFFIWRGVRPRTAEVIAQLKSEQ